VREDRGGPEGIVVHPYPWWKNGGQGVPLAPLRQG